MCCLYNSVFASDVCDEDNVAECPVCRRCSLRALGTKNGNTSNLGIETSWKVNDRVKVRLTLGYPNTNLTLPCNICQKLAVRYRKYLRNLCRPMSQRSQCMTAGNRRPFLYIVSDSSVPPPLSYCPIPAASDVVLDPGHHIKRRRCQRCSVTQATKCRSRLSPYLDVPPQHMHVAPPYLLREIVRGVTSLLVVFDGRTNGRRQWQWFSRFGVI